MRSVPERFTDLRVARRTDAIAGNATSSHYEHSTVAGGAESTDISLWMDGGDANTGSDLAAEAAAAAAIKV